MNIPTFKTDEGSLYTSEGCPNTAVTRGTAPSTVKLRCGQCPEDAFAKGVSMSNPLPDISTIAPPVVEDATPSQPAVEPVVEAVVEPVVEVLNTVEPVVGLPLDIAPPSAPVIETVAEPVAASAPVAAAVPLEEPSFTPVAETPKKPKKAADEPVVNPDSSTFLPGINLAGLGDESVVDVNEVLSGIPGLEGGPSSGGLSWHDLTGPATCWRKAYYQMVLALRKKTVSPALGLGTLVHACMELHYRSGGTRTFEACDAVAAAGAVKVAADARKYVYGYLSKYGQEEAETWDVRGLEVQGTLFMPEEKIGSKKVSIPLTCRHDMVVAMREPGAPCVPPGEPVPHGSFVLDFKTCRALTYNLTKGYGMDGQFLMNALIYKRAEAEYMGPLAGIIIALIAKHKHVHPDKSFYRMKTTVDDRSVDEFYTNEVKPLALETYRRLSDKNIKGDMYKWPKNRAACIGPYGPCFFFDICDTAPGHEDAVIADSFVQQEERIKNVDAFLQPPPCQRSKPAAEDLGEKLKAKEKTVEVSKAEVRAVLKGKVLESFIRAVAEYPEFKPEAYLTEQAKKKDVKKALAEALSESWEAGSQFQLPLFDFGVKQHILFNVSNKGISWQVCGKRGSWTFTSLSNDISKSWWDSKKFQPSSAPAEEVLTGPEDRQG